MTASRASARIDGFSAPAGGVLPAPEQQRLAEAEPGADGGEGLGAHDGGADPGEVPLRQLRMVAVEVLGDDDPEHRVAEELEPFVRLLARHLGAVGTVAQGEVQ